GGWGGVAESAIDPETWKGDTGKIFLQKLASNVGGSLIGAFAGKQAHVDAPHATAGEPAAKVVVPVDAAANPHAETVSMPAVDPHAPTVAMPAVDPHAARMPAVEAPAAADSATRPVEHAALPVDPMNPHIPPPPELNDPALRPWIPNEQTHWNPTRREAFEIPDHP